MKLKFEGGVHRVQRVPVTESQGRIHTSTATVWQCPRPETDIAIDPNDLPSTFTAVAVTADKRQHYRFGGTYYARPALIVTNQDEKSQIKNREKAMSVPQQGTASDKIDEESAKLTAERRALIGGGDAREKIHFNFPQDRITDHRIGYSRSNIPAAMNEDIDDLIERLQTYERGLKAQRAN